MASVHFLLKRGGAALLLLAAVLSLLLIALQPSRAQTLTTLHSFAGYPSDGARPSISLILDAQGNLYGATAVGGVFPCSRTGCGTVFKVAPNGTETVLHNFGPGRSAFELGDGMHSYGSLFMDAQGNLYGGTSSGGEVPYGYGAVFELTPTGRESLLYTFGGYDAVYPGYVVMDPQGNLYGTTGGDGQFSWGTVFKLAPNGTMTTLYTFTGGADGGTPSALLLDAHGNLFGTTSDGGDCNRGCGVVFELSPPSGGGPWTETVLYAFTGGAEGSHLSAGLVADAQGNLYGTTWEGGKSGGGTVFEVSPSGTETVLYSFCSQLNCADGGYPNGSLIFDAHGNLYGTTFEGGQPWGAGVVFELAANGNESVLHSFNPYQSGSPEGGWPSGGLVMDADGNLYGTTSGGGTDNLGTVFKLTP